MASGDFAARVGGGRPIPVLIHSVFFVAMSFVAVMACHPARGATPGLPFTEDFNSANLRDGTPTSANWDTGDGELLLAEWRTRAVAMQWADGIDAGGETDSTTSVAVGDVDGDGDLDVVVGHAGRNRLYFNDATETPFADAPLFVGTDEDSTTSIALGDVDGDGRLDVVVGNDGQTNKFYLNDGLADPFCSAGMDIGTDFGLTTSIAVGDIDGDGDLDVVAGNDGQNKLYVNGGGPEPFVNDAIDIGNDAVQTNSVAIGDVDNDGRLDVVAGNVVRNKLYINDGTDDPLGNAGIDIGGESDITLSIALGDVDNDGLIDVVVGNSGSTDKLYLNSGTATAFSTASAYSTFGAASGDTQAVALGDIDNDGDLDIVTGRYAQNKVYLNGSAIFDDATATLIPDNECGLGNTEDVVIANVTTHFAVSDVDLGFNATHTWRSDLQVTLVSPLGTEVNVIDFTDNDKANNYDVLLDDSSTNPLDEGGNSEANLDDVAEPYYDRDAMPTNPLSGFNGEDAFGEWVLKICDDSGTAFGNYKRSRLILNGGVFSAEQDLSVDADDTQAVALADIDADGDLDAVAGNSTATNRLYRVTGASTANVEGLEPPFDTVGNVAVSMTVNAAGDVFGAGVFLTASHSLPPNTSVDYYLCPEENGEWFKVGSGEFFPFPEGTVVTDLRWMARLNSLSPSLTPVIDSIEIDGDFDGDLIRDDEDDDDDNDGMSDAYENAHSDVLNPYDAGDADIDHDGDGLTSLEESMLNPPSDPSDPDSDGDGIDDGLDDNPMLSDNLCSGPDAILTDEVVMKKTCAARSSITVRDPASVTANGSLRLISPLVIFESGVWVDGALSGDMPLTVISDDPCLNCGP